jgi:hypothetical protein
MIWRLCYLTFLLENFEIGGLYLLYCFITMANRTKYKFFKLKHSKNSYKGSLICNFDRYSTDTFHLQKTELPQSETPCQLSQCKVRLHID